MTALRCCARCAGKSTRPSSQSADKPYRSGRSTDWLEIKCTNEQEFVVAAYTRSDVVARPFSSLVLALHEGGKPRYAGHVGTGFTVAELRRVRAMMKALERSLARRTQAPRRLKIAFYGAFSAD